MKIRTLFLSAVLLASCGSDPVHQPKPIPSDGYADAGMTVSALSPGQFCNAASDNGCLTTWPRISDNGWTCVVGGYPIGFKAQVMMAQVTSGSSWYERITTENCEPHSFNSQCPPGWNTLTIQGGGSAGAFSYLPMTYGAGFLYLSQNVALRMTQHYTDFNRDIPVTLLGGNLQYYPADASHPHGTWYMWITAPNQPNDGVCGNIALSWSPTT
jgi:hypothetical protein